MTDRMKEERSAATLNVSSEQWKKERDRETKRRRAVATGTAPNVTYVADFKGLDDGIYMLVETTTLAGYNTADPVYFEVEAEHSEAADGTTSVELTVYDGTVTERPGQAWQDGTMPVYYTFTRTGEHENVTATTTVITTTIVNNAGTVLPSTGGPGRTWIYIIASIMILGAGVILVAMSVSKRRSEEN